MSPCYSDSLQYSQQNIYLGSNFIANLEVVSSLNTLNLGSVSYWYYTTTSLEKYNPRVYLGTTQVIASGWNRDYQQGITLPEIWPEKTPQKGEANYELIFLFKCIIKFAIILLVGKSMNELQRIEFDLLKIFVAFCEKHNLKYYLSDGSTLGAIRHQGFIPWDDDIDVCMPRKDYDRFIELASKEFTGDVFLQTYKSDKYYTYAFAKLRNSNTTYVETYFKHSKINHGVWIDIFPLDGLMYKDTSKRTLIKYRLKRIWLYVYLCYPRSAIKRVRPLFFYIDIFYNLFMYLFYFLNACSIMTKHIEKKMKKIPYDEAHFVTNYLAGISTRKIFTKDIFGEGKKVLFEGLEVVVPEKYDEYLKILYGDYMKFPPKEKQVSKHKTSGFDLNTPYYIFNKRYPSPEKLLKKAKRKAK